DWQWTSQSATACGLFCFNATAPGFAQTFLLTVQQKINWFATVRGRLGWANDGALIYVTAGGAWAGVNETDSALLTATVAPGSPAGASFSRTASGAAVGAGIEMRLWAGWTGKVEYLHLDLGGATNTYAIPQAIGFP